MNLRETTLAACTPDARRLRLHVPDGVPPGHGWPLLILLDGDWIWPLDSPLESGTACAVLIPGHGGMRGPVLPRSTRQGLSVPTGPQAQALARAEGGRKGKGGAAARACLRLLEVARQFQGPGA